MAIYRKYHLVRLATAGPDTYKEEATTHMAPQELLAAYAEIIKNADNEDLAMKHLASFLADAAAIARTIAVTIEQARARAQG